MLARWVVATCWALVVLLAGAVVAAGEPAAAPGGSKGPARAAGALVVAYEAGARPAAWALARVVYRDPKLRPTIDEAMAQVLVTAPPPDPPAAGAATSPAEAARAEVAAVLRTLPTATPAARKRLLTSLGNELGATLVVVVSGPADAPTARVLRVAEKRFVAVSLVAKPVPPQPPSTAPELDWSDGVAIVRGLVDGPAPGPRTAPRGGLEDEPVGAAPGAEEGTDEVDLLTSPWFWAGLGVVVTVGVTVFVLSQTVLEEPGVVVLEGQVAE